MKKRQRNDKEMTNIANIDKEMKNNDKGLTKITKIRRNGKRYYKEMRKE